MSFFKHIRTCAAAIVITAFAGGALAQDFPNRSIKMVVAFPPGGPTDFVARLLADKMKPLLGQSVIIENKAGANAAIGADFVAKSEADGYTLFFTTMGAVAINPNLRADLPYNPVRDFAPITLVVNTPEVLVVRPEMAVKTAKDLANLALSKADGITMASTGVGSPPHLALELFQSAEQGQGGARAISRRRARGHRRSRRTGPGLVRRPAGADAAHSRRQAQADRDGREDPRRDPARRADPRRARACPGSMSTTGTRCSPRPARPPRSSPSSMRRSSRC